jgi:cob(I)alamin adenosyltransferase
MSIATKHGDDGQTGLAGVVRVSKADLSVEACGSVDELNSFLGFARSICQNANICAWTEAASPLSANRTVRRSARRPCAPSRRRQPPYVRQAGHNQTECPV